MTKPNIEDKFRRQLGDLTFAVTVLQHQLEEAAIARDALQAEIEELRNPKGKK